MNPDIVKKLSQLRVSIAMIGETKKWWNTKFFDSTSNTFVNYIFPRSENANKIIAGEIIQRIIDEKVGANHYHLFRLSINQEEEIHKFLKSENIDVKNTNDAFQILEDISEELSIDKTPGPKNIGTIEQFDNNVIQAFAAEYLAAFRNDYETYPYLK
jgi:hypothetical protein